MARFARSEALLASFIGNYFNKIDRKGRISMPAKFRHGLAEERCQEIVLFPSREGKAIEACSQHYMTTLIRGLRRLQASPEQKDAIARTFYSQIAEVPFDGEGRINLPRHLIEFAELGETAHIMGRGEYIQFWNPEILKAANEAANQAVTGTAWSLSGLAELGSEP